MKALSRLAAFVYLFHSFQFAHSTYSACQLGSSGESALVGCLAGTLYVSPTDSNANFTKVQEAIDSLPESGDAVILIGKGDYLEAINVTRSAPLTLLGQLDPSTASTGNASERNIVRIWNEKCAQGSGGATDEMTATLTVAPAENQPFGNVDFRAYNINFDNNGCSSSVSQALVTQFTYSNVSFYGCTFASYQDTWYTGYGANSYVVDSIIYGQTDYIFGYGTAWFQSVTLANRGCGGGITAWKGTSGTNNGVYIVDSNIIRSPDASTETTHSCYLGRPWNDYAVAVYSGNYMDDSIAPGGFRSWDMGGSISGTTYFAEFNSSGPGGDTSSRVTQDHILSSAQAGQYTIQQVFGGSPEWIDLEYKSS